MILELIGLIFSLVFFAVFLAMFFSFGVFCEWCFYKTVRPDNTALADAIRSLRMTREERIAECHERARRKAKERQAWQIAWAVFVAVCVLAYFFGYYSASSS
jgi:hypothetical protein